MQVISNDKNRSNEVRVGDDFFIVRFKLAYSNSAKRRSEQTSVYFKPHLALFMKLQEAYPEYKHQFSYA